MTEEALNSERLAPLNPTAASLGKSSDNSNNVNSASNNAGGATGARVLTMTEQYKYQIVSKTLYSGFHNLAWLQAVKNKSLEEALVMMKGSVIESSNGKYVSNGAADLDNIDEKEEGELEEGEIDANSDLAMQTKDSDANITNGFVREDVTNKVITISKLVDDVRQELENLNIDNAEISFDKMYSCMERTVNSMQELIFGSYFAEKDAFIEVLLAALEKLYSVFFSMTSEFQEQRKNIFLRLVQQIASIKPPIFSPQQLKQVETISSSIMMLSGSSVNISNHGRSLVLASDITDSLLLSGKTINLSVLKYEEENEPVSLSCQNESFLAPCSKSGLMRPKNRELSLPLLDIHKDHDADSLPSPTSSDALPSKKGFIQMNSLEPQRFILIQPSGHENSVTHPYENDALKSVSSYQQKFGHKSFSISDKLPSPTPSEEEDPTDSHCIGEVWSSTSFKAKPSASSIHPDASVVCPSMSSGDTVFARGSTQVAPIASKSEKPASQFSMKSRDPRLRLGFIGLGAGNLKQSQSGSLSSNMTVGHEISQKKNVIDDVAFDSRAPKRRRNDLGGLNTFVPLLTAVSNEPVTSPTISHPFSGPNVSPFISGKMRASNPNGTAPLHSLLREIADNSSMLQSILKTISKNSSEDVQMSTQAQSSNSMQGEVAPNSQEGMTSNIRMKPRDPRHVLHTSVSEKHKNGRNEKSEVNKSSRSATSGNLSSVKSEDQLVKNVTSSAGLRPPDLSLQFISHFKNTAGILSLPVYAETTSRPVQCPGAGIVSECGKVGNETYLTPEATIAAPSKPQNGSAWSDFEHLFEGYDDQQKATIQKERARRLEEQNKMFSDRKLCLVLDLDHTLLNSAKFSEVDLVHDEILRRKEEQDCGRTQRHLFRFPHMGMWTKLRPGIWNFLDKASKLYELHLYTMGNKCYANEMAKLLDPNGELFSGRVISRGDNGEPFDSDDRVPKCKDLEGVLGMESAVVIIDDSARVWPLNKLNLIVVERYIYFPYSRRQFGLPGPSLLEIDHDERPDDGTLAAALAVIGKIHENFFSHHLLDEADVRTILASEQQKILAGCCIVFSRVFPVGEANPHMHPLWQTAEQFGGVCVNQISEQVTHVVANSPGTDKVNWALSTGRFVVHPGWVEASALLYRRANEHDFAIKP